MAPINRWKRWVYDGIIVFLIAVLLLVGAELTLRVLRPSRIQALNAASSDRRAYQMTSKYGQTLRPNIQATYIRAPINGGDIIHWRTNSHGFRGDELRSTADVRILVYGDSNVQARFSSLKDTFSFRVEQELIVLTKRKVEVINAGVIGAGPDQSLLRFIDDAPRYHPDIVVFHIFADNDFGDLLRNAVFYLNDSGALVRKRLFSVDSLSFVEHLRDQIPPLLVVHIPTRMIKRIRTKGSAVHIQTKLTDAKAGLSEGEQLLNKFADASKTDYVSYKRRVQTSGDHYDLDLALFPKRESSKVKIALMTAILRQAKEFAGNHKIHFLVVIQPSASDLTTNFPLNYKQLTGRGNYRPENLTTVVQAVCRANDIHYVNLFPVFRNNNPEKLFFKGRNNHWNDEGQRLAAKVTARYLYDTFPLAKKAGP